MNLIHVPLFHGLNEEEIQSLLHCLHAIERTYKKGKVILAEGGITENIGIVLSGMAMISCGDVWGNNSILGNVAPGSVFAEVYACIAGQPLLVNVSAAEDTTVLFMNVQRVLSTCTSACPFHARLAQNLLTVCAHKSLQLSQRMLQYSLQVYPRTIIVLLFGLRQAGWQSYLSHPIQPSAARRLSERRPASALCNELSKMQKEGWITYKRNQITLKTVE